VLVNMLVCTVKGLMYLYRSAGTDTTTASVRVHGDCLNVDASMYCATIVPISTSGTVESTMNT
jgi:hypothetical protein